MNSFSQQEVSSQLEARHATVMFQDIVDFTRMAEEVDPTTLAAITGEYMTAMTSIIHQYGGTVDKYIGDCIMSLWNAPEKLHHHAERAVRAALDCQTELDRLNPSWNRRYGYSLRQRIGIHTGRLLVGTMGSVHRMNWTAIGDTVNVAARLEGVNKFYGTNIMISDALVNKLPKEEDYIWRKLSTVRVSGRSNETAIYEVTKVVHGKRELFRLYEDALSKFQNREFSMAQNLLEQALTQCPEDMASRLLVSRVRGAARQIPLPDDWSYVENLVK